MTTSIIDLLDAIDAELASVGAADAAATLARIARVVDGLNREGLDANPNGQREIAAKALATSAGTSGSMFATDDGRVAMLTGVLGDAIGKLRDDMNQSARWATTIRLAVVARKCLAVIEESGPFDHLTAVGDLERSISNVRRAATHNPPDHSRCAAMTQPIASAHPDAAASPAERIYEATAGVVDLLNRRGREPIGIRQAIGVSRMADRLARGAAALIPDEHLIATADTWRAVSEHLGAFEDGLRVDGADRILQLAIGLYEGLEQLGRSPVGGLEAADVDHLHRAVRLLPAIAATLDVEIGRRRGALMVPIGPQPLREERVSEWLAGKAFVASRDDLREFQQAFASAERSVVNAPGIDRLVQSLDL